MGPGRPPVMGSILDPRSDTGRAVESLWWLLLAVSVVVLLAVVVLTTIAVVRGRRRKETGPMPGEPPWGSRFIVVSGLALPAIILTSVFVVSTRQLSAIADDPGEDVLTIDVIGHMWWWEVRYPGGAVTANEIHVPVGEPVRIRLRSADVIHSFWVPALGPKMDAIPGRTNALRVVVEEPGRYRGQCAEFCGLQHAHMAMFVVADPRFDRWLDAMEKPAADPTAPAEIRGLDVFLTSTCAGCHTIRGTDADETVGPDLTHLASRETIAGSWPNDASHLARFVSDPQSLKPGAVMPPTSLSPGELEDLVAYLGSLR